MTSDDLFLSAQFKTDKNINVMHVYQKIFSCENNCEISCNLKVLKYKDFFLSFFFHERRYLKYEAFINIYFYIQRFIIFKPYGLA